MCDMAKQPQPLAEQIAEINLEQIERIKEVWHALVILSQRLDEAMAKVDSLGGSHESLVMNQHEAMKDAKQIAQEAMEILGLKDEEE